MLGKSGKRISRQWEAFLVASVNYHGERSRLGNSGAHNAQYSLLPFTPFMGYKDGKSRCFRMRQGLGSCHGQG